MIIRAVHRRDERGVSMILVAMMMTVLLVVAGLVLDVGNASQERRQAQNAADAAALAGANDLTNGLNATAVVADIKTYVAKNFGTVTWTGCADSGALAIQPDTGDACISWDFAPPNTTHVRVTIPTRQVKTFFGSVAHVDFFNVTASAVAKTGGYGPGGPPASSCVNNELSTTVHNPIGTPKSGKTPVVLTAQYSAAAPIDPQSIVFIAPNGSGNLVKLLPAQYTLTVSGNTATISYTDPTGLSTATASLFATDINGTDCGEVAWSSCPVSTHDNFMETLTQGIADHGMAGTDTDPDESLSATQLADAALIADADDSVTPGPGQQVGPGSTLGATYHDETDINKTKSQLFLGGVAVTPTFTTLAQGSGDNAYNYNMSYVLPQTTQSGWNSAFLYFWDADVTSTGGDCALAQWAFKFGGFGTINLTQ